MGNNRTIIFRLVAGAYLLYLGFQLLKGYSSGAESGNPMVSLIGGIAFLAISAFIIFTAVRVLIISYKEYQEVPEETEVEDTELASEEDEEETDTDAGMNAETESEAAEDAEETEEA